jgi:1,4-dihydroxy-2-naphthoyl-CoA hydrolase
MNPGFTLELLRERILGSQSFPHDMALEPIELTDERAVGRMLVDERHLHPGGIVHAGAFVALADSVAGWQTFRHLEPGEDFTSIEMKLNVLAAGNDGDELIATAEHLHAGRSTHVVQSRVRCGDRLVANLIVTQFVIPAKEG